MPFLPKFSHRLRKATTRLYAIAFVVASFVEAGLVWSFMKIPNAHTYLPLHVVSDPSVYDWPPNEAPSWFRVDDPTVTEAAYFREALQLEVDPEASTFDRQLAVMGWVRKQAVVADSVQAISGDPIAVHQAILNGVPAQCGNFSTLYIAACTSVGLPHVRMWHCAAENGWNGYGHIVNEVWVPELGKWVMVDPMNNAYVLVDGEPGSVIEIRELVLTGQVSRLEPVVGSNAHVPPDQLLDLYAQTMAIVSLEASHTPLRDYYRLTWSDRLIQVLPDVAGLPYLADRAIALTTGEARHITLIDELSGEQAHRLPVGQSQMIFWAILVVAVIILTMGMRLACVGIRQLMGRLASRRRHSVQVGVVGGKE